MPTSKFGCFVKIKSAHDEELRKMWFGLEINEATESIYTLSFLYFIFTPGCCPG